jgi:putative sigma-54 modulation protein
MELTIQGHNLKVTETLEDEARRRLEKLERYLPNIASLRVDFAHEKTKRGQDIIGVEITIRHQRGAILRAEERGAGDASLVLSDAVDKMYRQIERFKGKRSRKGRERFSMSAEELATAEAIPESEPFVEDEMNGPEVARRKTVAVSAMTEAEAIEQMELLGHDFFMFFNQETGGVNVLYHRKSGGYGLLIPRVE